jgi:hypothetical protein
MGGNLALGSSPPSRPRSTPSSTPWPDSPDSVSELEFQVGGRDTRPEERRTGSPLSQTTWCSTSLTEGRGSSSSPDSVGASQGQEHKARGEGDRPTIVYGYLVFYLTEIGEREFILSRLSWCLSGAGTQGQRGGGQAHHHVRLLGVQPQRLGGEGVHCVVHAAEGVWLAIHMALDNIHWCLQSF